jgi:ABC-type dipeptide/oligopeptide/nickel transport system permease component
MIRYGLRRVLILCGSSFLLVTILFFGMRLMAGDPAMVALGDAANAESLARVRALWGLDKPILRQYGDFLGNLIRGDLGTAYSNGQPVAHLIAHALPYSVALGGASILGALLIGLPLGVLTAVKRGHVLDTVGRIVSLAGMSLPSFYIGILLLYVFAVRWRLFPVMGGGDPGNLADQVHHIFLPSLAGALYIGAYVTRFVRSGMLEVLQQDYVTTARGKGLRETSVIYKHALRNALIPVVTVVGLYFSMAFGGSVLLEIVFSRPGLGRLVLSAIQTRDYMLLQGVLLVYVVAVSVVNLAVDLSYGLIDPRICYG